MKPPAERKDELIFQGPWLRQEAGALAAAFGGRCVVELERGGQDFPHPIHKARENR